MSGVTKTDIQPYIDAFARGRKGAEPLWLADRRASALAHFETLGFPTRRQEAWRFTDLRPLQRAVLPPAAEEISGATPAIAGIGHAYRLVLVNGRFAPEVSDLAGLPKGIWLASTAHTIAERPELVEAAFDPSDVAGVQPFASLNAALFEDGFGLALAPGTALDRPIEIIHQTTAGPPRSTHLRHLILLGEGSRATVIERFAGEGVYWTNAVSELRLGARARLTHVKLQEEGTEAIHIALVRAMLAEAADYASFVMTAGARLSRHDTLAALTGADAKCQLDGVYLLRGTQEATNATFIDHQKPGGQTRELFKGVIDDRAHGVFLGTIAVRPDAQHTDAHQLNRNLLLSDRAVVDAKPELEILADDVKCSHGATVGDLEEDSLFYLLSRGLPLAEARRVLIEAFAMEAIERVEEGIVRDHLAERLRRWVAPEIAP